MILAKGMLIKSYKGYSIFDVVMVHMLQLGCLIRFDRSTSARTLWCIQVFLCAYTGLVTGFVRIATLFVVVLISVNRLNVSIMPAWLDSYASALAVACDSALAQDNGWGASILDGMQLFYARRLPQLISLDASRVCLR
jgi:hypothetical protein